jgi:hypothetical protein
LQQASDNAAKVLEERVAIAQKQAGGGKSASDILFQGAAKEINSELDKKGNGDKNAISASNFFFGAYFLNTRTRSEYCLKLGVPIEGFVAAYRERYKTLFSAAEKIQIYDFNNHGMTYDPDVFYKLLSPSIEKFITQDMSDAASTLKVSPREVCESMERDSMKWVNQMPLSPAIAEALLPR